LNDFPFSRFLQTPSGFDGTNTMKNICKNTQIVISMMDRVVVVCCILWIWNDLDGLGTLTYFEYIEHDLVIRTAFHGVAPSCSSASVGFCPRDRMRGPSSRVEMQPGWDPAGMAGRSSSLK
jgi:hypothetical protein